MVSVQCQGIIKFLGGAFIGVVPEVSYSYLLGLLGNEGYLIISVPYNVTFDHSRASREIYEKFFVCFDGILATGLPDFVLTSTDLVDLPVYCVGHSCTMSLDSAIHLCNLAKEMT